MPFTLLFCAPRLADGATASAGVSIDSGDTAWCGGLTYLLLRLVDAWIGLRVADDQENEGLDLALHGERGYSE